MIFSKQKKSKQLSVVHIVCALQKEKIGDSDFLEEIKLDLQEDIPLSQKKVEYLKEEVRKLKEIRSQTKSKTDLPKDIESKKDVKIKEKPPKKPRFSNILGRKNKKAPENIESELSKPQNPDMDKRVDEADLLRSAEKSSTSKKHVDSDSKITPETASKEKRAGFFKFLSVKKKPHRIHEKPAQSKAQNPSSQQLDENIPNTDDSKNATNLTDQNKTEDKIITQMDAELLNLQEPQELKMNIEQILNENTNSPKEETYGFEKSHSDIRHVIDDLNKQKELLKTDIEEAKQLDDIKQLLEELSKEKEQLKSNVEEIKRRVNVKPLVKKYDDIEQRLQSATDTLYSIQSNIYERIREIRILRKDLSAIKEDISTM